MTDKEKLACLIEAVRDRLSGALCDTSFFVVVAGIVLPPTMPTNEMIEWACKSIKEHEDDYQTPNWKS